VDLSSDDVQDILALLDDLPYGEMHLQTSRFSLVLRRASDGQWTQEMQLLAEPAVLSGAPAPTSAEEAGGAGGRSGAGQVGGRPGTGGAGSRSGNGEVEERSGAGEVEGRPGDAEADGLVAVRTPLPGTFYRAPRPGAPPFVDVGSHVQPDTVVAIVETMKLMNSVSAGVTGTVAEILLANAEPAERDAVLMLVREEG
jgi:acetyl-CoA carboxylase biotin carboxyl carrier protein